MKNCDVLVIGAGAVGTAIARELSKYHIHTKVVERLNDVGGDASKSNSAIIHTGFDAPPDSVESEMVVHANPMFDALCRDLAIPFSRVGAIMVATDETEEQELTAIMAKARKNRVFDVEYLTPIEIHALEPGVTDSVRGGLWIPRESIIDPFLLVIAQAENASENGVVFETGCEVTGLRRESESFVVDTTAGEVQAKYVVNAAGLRSDTISGYLGIDDFSMHPRRGQFHIIDRSAPLEVRHIILPVPTKITKGKLLTPTVEGNWLIGPTAEELYDKSASGTTADGLDEIIRGVGKLIPSIRAKDAINQYAGLRPVRDPGGYHLRSFDSVPGYVELSGIRSTGVSSSLAVALKTITMLENSGLLLEKRSDYVKTRKGIPKFRELDTTEQDRLIDTDPKYGRVVCRCETVTEGEIIEAIRRTPGARDVDGIKRRVRAGLGRCQAGFCGMRIPLILAEELGIPLEQVTKKGQGSELLIGKTKSVRVQRRAQQRVQQRAHRGAP